MESHLSPFQGKSLTMKLHNFAPVDIFSPVSMRQLYAEWHLSGICLGWMALSWIWGYLELNFIFSLQIQKKSSKLMMKSGTCWHCFYTCMGIYPRVLPLSSHQMHLCFSCEILWDQCQKQHVWQGISGLREKVQYYLDFCIIHICHFYLSLWVIVLFFPNCKIQDFCFCLTTHSTGATDKVQDGHADYQLFPQTTEEL